MTFTYKAPFLAAAVIVSLGSTWASAADDQSEVQFQTQAAPAVPTGLDIYGLIDIDARGDLQNAEIVRQQPATHIQQQQQSRMRRR